MMHWVDYGSGMGFGWLFMIVLWSLIILGIVYLIKLIAGGIRKKQVIESPMDILKKRYAKGEITGEEFEKMQDDLRRS